MIRVGVLFGGKSPEHEVSRCSAASVFENLNKDKYVVLAIGIDKIGKWFVQENAIYEESKEFGKQLKIVETGDWIVKNYGIENKLIMIELKSGQELSFDVVIPVLHGTNCEDGTLQGLLELIDVPFVGADTLGSAIGMDKDTAKRLVAYEKINVVPWTIINIYEWTNFDKQVYIQDIKSKYGFPVFVKPNRSGSSVGVTKVNNVNELSKAIDFAFEHDTKILIEKAIDAREIECAVIGNNVIKTSPLGEILPKKDFYSYEAKYLDKEGADLAIPAQLDELVSLKVRDLSARIFRALNCLSMARVDFFVDKITGEIYFNEINTLPGFTSISMFSKLWNEAGMEYPNLLDTLIHSAFEKHEEKKQCKFLV
jgi:D-alanine-D-alanine ligase